MAVIVRATSDPLTLVPAIRRTVAGLDDKLALYDIRTLEQLVDRSLAVERFATLVLTSFAAGALLLAAIGLYGVIAFTVATRTREIGLRLALGASRAAVLWMVVWDGLSVVLAGLVVGLPLALLLSNGVQAFLFQTPPADPVVLDRRRCRAPVHRHAGELSAGPPRVPRRSGHLTAERLSRVLSVSPAPQVGCRPARPSRSDGSSWPSSRRRADPSNAAPGARTPLRRCTTGSTALRRNSFSFSTALFR